MADDYLRSLGRTLGSAMRKSTIEHLRRQGMEVNGEDASGNGSALAVVDVGMVAAQPSCEIGQVHALRVVAEAVSKHEHETIAAAAN